ncbi:glycosyl hydrolase family 43 [Aquimarina sp. BL5]|uniref:family 43 glycosylhydrolase n=1 Tax=Aquimarina sp. BL5 TaxID=1714860 RepID=UPI000E4EFBA1|nr:family 43 glycosylhydrolase [Aquimarina sp. BL5]AXT50232.1 glycosyl hydrolase family 43 [Aquimarina sp. BL5]RKN09548.1 carbohydrate-binding protein [Aquimarina sp. BL5]
MYKKRSILFLILYVVATLQLFSQNPLVTHMYTADPTARVFNGKLYVFPSTDIVCEEGKGENGFCMPSYNVFSSEDLTNWTDHGKIIDQTDVPWGKKDGFGMWAPDCVEKDGTYYYYYPAPPLDKSGFRRVGVATAKKPEGPYVLEKNYIKGVNGIDPNVLNDDDGKSYIYFGGGKKLYVAELNSDMKSIKGKAKEIEGLPDGYKEGPFMFKKDGLYYFTFPHDKSGSEEIAYATGTNPMGPFEYQGKIMERWKDGIWTNHHSILEYKKQWYIFYHHHDISNNQHLRSMRADSLFFGKKGQILKTKATLRGIGITSAKEHIQIDRFSKSKNVKVSKLKDDKVVGWQLDYIQNGSFVTYNAVDFRKKYNKVIYRVSSGSDGGNIKLYVDGKLISTTKVENTGNWNTWKTVETPINKKIKGIKNIKLVFEGDSSDYLLNIDWLKFE